MSVDRKLRVVSVCRNLPTPDNPAEGTFIHSRLAAIAARADLSAVHPVPYFPVVRPLPEWATEESRRHQGMEILNAPMFYLPGIFKMLDGRWLARSIESIVTNLHRESPVDLIDAHFGYPEGVGCLSVGRRLGIPVYITVRGLETDRVREWLIGSQMTHALRQAAGCIAVSNTLADLLVDLGVDPHRVRVIHNAVDQGIFSIGDPAQDKIQVGVEVTQPLVVSIGRLVSLKRHHILLDAFGRLLEHSPDALLVIIGGRSYESDYPDKLLARVDRLGIGRSVRFVGSVPPSEVVRWLKAADVFALLSEREGCSNALLEALAVGVPAVVTPVGDNPYFVVPERDGYLVPVDDSEATAAALVDSIERRDWDRKGISARLAARAGNWDIVADSVLSFFHETLN